jgi:hypothetical protein
MIRVMKWRMMTTDGQTTLLLSRLFRLPLRLMMSFIANTRALPVESVTIITLLPSAKDGIHGYRKGESIF